MVVCMFYAALARVQYRAKLSIVDAFQSGNVIASLLRRTE